MGRRDGSEAGEMQGTYGEDAMYQEVMGKGLVDHRDLPRVVRRSTIRKGQVSGRGVVVQKTSWHCGSASCGRADCGGTASDSPSAWTWVSDEVRGLASR